MCISMFMSVCPLRPGNGMFSLQRWWDIEKQVEKTDQFINTHFIGDVVINCYGYNDRRQGNPGVKSSQAQLDIIFTQRMVWMGVFLTRATIDWTYWILIKIVNVCVEWCEMNVSGSLLVF